MTYDSIDDLLDDVIHEIETNAKQLSLVAAKAGEAALKLRIFNEGKATDETRIGSYSTNAASYGRSAFAVKSKFKPAAGRATMYVRDGYAGLRQLNGRQSAYVDLSYTGSLMRAIVTRTSADGYAVVIQDPQEISIAAHNESRFGKTIFNVSASDVADMEVAVNLEIKAILSKYLS